MEAFGKLLSNVAQTVDEFMASNISENQARDFLVSSYPSQFEIDTGGDGPIVKHEIECSRFGRFQEHIRPVGRCGSATSRKRSWFPPRGVNWRRTGIRCWPRW